MSAALSPEDRDLERALMAEFKRTCDEAKKLRYNPTYFRQMLGQRGPIETAKTLLTSGNPASGFAELCALRRYDLSVEAIVLRDRWCKFFAPEELAEARQRLESVHYHWEEHPDCRATRK